MDTGSMSEELGVMMYHCAHSFVPEEMYASFQKLILQLSNQLNFEFLKKGFLKTANEYYGPEVEADGIYEDALQEFDLEGESENDKLD